MKLTILIAEDDPAMRHVLKKTLNRIPDVEVVGEAEDGETALDLVGELHPRVIFIDIDLPKKNGLEMAREICDIDPYTFLVFATGYDNYTQEAFEVYAYDYLVKPFKLYRIQKTIDRIKKQIEPRPVSNQCALSSTDRTRSSRLVVKKNDKLFFLDTEEIILITREKKTTIIYTAKGYMQISENLNSLEKRLQDSNFFRSHRGFIINLKMIRELHPWGRGAYEVSFVGTRQKALLSREKAREMEEILALPK